MIRAAETRAQITQIEKLNTAVNAFRGKFNAIPGDMNVTAAINFGFAQGVSCTGGQGRRDGNGLIDGQVAPDIYYQGFDETELFWQDLSSSVAGGLIEGSFPNGSAPAVLCGNSGNADALPLTGISGYLPVAKLGRGNFIYVYENNGMNWYGISQVLALGNLINTNAGIPVVQAYNIDSKTDDGLPTTGNVQAVYIKNSYTALSTAPSAATDGSTTCYNTTANVYSTGYSNGAGANCALSFKMQGGG